MAYTPSEACIAAADKAAGGILSRADLDAAFEEAVRLRDKLRADGNVDGMADRLRDAVAAQAERTRIAAAMQRRHAALNALARDRLDQTLDAFKAAGLKPAKALLAVMEGTNQGVMGGRVSVAAKSLAYEARYVGGMMAEIQRERPHLVNALADKRLSDDIMREMAELRDGGKPGRTGNKDAEYLARVFATYAELSRTDLNRLGASIGKLDGWAGAQVHDDIKMVQAGRDAWIDTIGPLLDYTRTFPDAESAAEVRDILGSVYDTIVTGVSNRRGAAEKGQRVNPANLAKSLGKDRVLHFKDAEAAIAYRDQFGYGNTVYGMMHHQRRAAQVAAQMETFGPNPEVMLKALVESEKRKIRDSGLSPAAKQKRLQGLDTGAGSLRGAMDVMSGMVSRPGSATGARIGANIRAWESMSKLGGAVLTAMPTDVVGAAQAAMFRGSGFWKGMVQQVDGMFRGRPKGEQAEISYLYGEGFDGLSGEINSRGLAQDGPMGKMSKLMDQFFKWNGLTWWTDVGRSVAGRTIAAEMGMRAGTAFDALPANYRHVLGLHGIDEARWNAIGAAGPRLVGGKRYITPDAVRELPDEIVEPLVAKRIEAARTASRVDDAKGADAIAKRQADFEQRRDAILNDGRRELELTLLRFVSDETNYAIIETDAASRRIATLGTRPGTLAGEAVRFIMQFKGFPIAFTQRVLGRALYGHAGATAGQRALAGLPHLGAIMAGLTVAGYMSTIMKDAAKGYWPPRDPTDPKVIVAALTQGGALGIYGDFLFGQANRFGSGLLETGSGPVIGGASDLFNLYAKARDGNPKAADYLNFALQNTPFINLAYVRPALDAMFLNSLRDAASPGYTRRQERNRMKQYGQSNFLLQ